MPPANIYNGSNSVGSSQKSNNRCTSADFHPLEELVVLGSFCSEVLHRFNQQSATQRAAE